MYKGSITDVQGIKVGHVQNNDAMTGCTAIICDKGATAGVDVRGGAPGTRETDLLRPENMIDKIHAVVLAGGSAFGLDAASGAMAFLEENDIGFDVGVTKVPIVTSAVIFDLTIGDYRVRPDYKMGYEACRNATSEENRQGNIGCGLGATVGKILGEKSVMKSGLGTASLNIGDLWVGALVVVNCFGDVFDYKSNEQLIGAINKKDNQFINTYEIMKNKDKLNFSGQNTTIGVVATNAKLTKAEANKVAQLGQNGLARSINPIHTMLDGDTIFAISTGEVEVDINLVGTLASEAVSMAISNGAKSADGYGAIPSWKDLKKL
ncbi:MAG: P1 family peptidase [Firmicutes bacterium]|nr:P1 family peptidase [Bacillota bacterium]